MKYTLVDSMGTWSQGPFHNLDDVWTHVKTMRNREFEGQEICLIEPNDGDNGLTDKERKRMIAQCHKGNTPLLLVVPLQEPR